MSYFCLGAFDIKKAGHEEWYYSVRQIFLDCRGDLLVHPQSYLSWRCALVTQSHTLSDGVFGGESIDKRVHIDEYAWIASFAILYNCHIMHHGIVSIGSVVRNLTVPPYHVAEGNPAKLVTRWDLDQKRWIRLDR